MSPIELGANRFARYRLPLLKLDWDVFGQFHILDVAAQVLHSEFKRLLLTWGGIAEKVCVLAQGRLELALEHGLHLFRNVHTGRRVLLVGRVNAEPNRRRITDVIPVVPNSDIDVLSQLPGIEVNDKLIEKPPNKTNREILEEKRINLQRPRLPAG